VPEIIVILFGVGIKIEPEIENVLGQETESKDDHKRQEHLCDLRIHLHVYNALSFISLAFSER